jgi:NADP-dependent 3-hydroxy acid dehydrogenase YdfG
MDINGKTVLITGAANGIGAALALEFAQRGADLFLTDVDREGLARTQKGVEATGRACQTQLTDVSDKTQVEQMVGAAIAEYGHVDILINNAGVTLLGETRDYSLNDWEWIVGVNLWGPIYGVHYVLPHMLRRKKGHIVNIASAGGLLGVPGNGAYAATKFGIVGFSEVLRAEVKQHGVEVTVICPAGIDTEFEQHARVREWRRFQPGEFVKGRKLSPAELARRVARAVEANRFIVLTGFGARLFYLVKRLAPSLYRRLQLKLAEDLSRLR